MIRGGEFSHDQCAVEQVGQVESKGFCDSHAAVMARLSLERASQVSSQNVLQRARGHLHRQSPPCAGVRCMARNVPE